MSSKVGRTPLAEGLASGQPTTAILLLESCPSDPEYFVSDVPLLHRVAAIGSKRLYDAMNAKISLPTDLASDGSSPLHFITGRVDRSLFEALEQIYGIEHTTNDGRTPFETVLAWAKGHREVDLWTNENSLDPWVFEALLPKSHGTKDSGGNRHVWEYFCEDIVDSWSESAWETYLPSLVFPILVRADVVRTYEQVRTQSALTPLCHSLARLTHSTFEKQPWVLALLRHALDKPSIFNDISQSSEIVAILKKAIYLEMLQLATFLVRKGVSVNIKEKGRSAIEESCTAYGLQMFQLMMDVDEKSVVDNVGAGGMDLFNLLINSSTDSAFEKIEILLRAGADPNSVCGHRSMRQPAVMLAAKRESSEVVDLFLDHGADIWAKNLQGADLAKTAAEHGNLKLISRIQHDERVAKYDWNSRAQLSSPYLFHDGCHILHFAASTGQDHVIRYLLDEKLVHDIDVRSADLLTPLHLAAKGGHISTLECLVENGADLDATARDGEHTTNFAFEGNCIDAVEALMKLRSDRLLNFASAAEGTRSASLLHPELNQNGSLSARSATMQLRYFESVISRGDLDLCKRLVSRGCSVNEPLPSCHSCHSLACAIRHKQPDIALWLLEQGACAEMAFCSEHRSLRYGTIHSVVSDPALFDALLPRLLDTALEQEYKWCDGGISPVHIATHFGNISALRTIVSHIQRNAHRYQ